MHGIHTHIPETNHVPRGYIVAAILSLLFMVPLFLVPALDLLLLLYFYLPVVLLALMTELINVKHNYCALYTVLWRDFSTQYGHLQGSNIKFIKITVV
jgi:hypothetical protein